MRLLLICMSVLSGVLALPAFVHASFTVGPVVVSEKAKPRDILKGELRIRNTSQSQITLYADVRDIDPLTGPVETVFGHAAKHERSLANWIEITRGAIILGVDETVTIPYLIHVNVRAQPDHYHAHVSFREGPNRPSAMEQPRSEQIVLFSVEIEDPVVERINLGTFSATRSFVLDDSAQFSYVLRNVGNRAIAPRGAIRIYDRRGKEIATLPVNNDGTTISPDDARALSAAWSTDGRFGRYKAYLDVQYGLSGAVNDTVYFWVMPWRELMIALFLLVLAVLTLLYLIHTRLVYAPPTRGERPLQPTAEASNPISVSDAEKGHNGAAVVLSPRRDTNAYDEKKHVVTISKRS